MSVKVKFECRHVGEHDRIMNERKHDRFDEGGIGVDYEHPETWTVKATRVEDRSDREIEEGQSRYLIHVSGASCPTCGNTPRVVSVEGLEGDYTVMLS